jgi:DNA-binding NarL/FixJ family response regulator
MIRVLVAEHQPILLRGIELILKNAGDLQVADYAENWEEVIEKTNTEKNRFDLLLVDLSLPGGKWTENLREHRTRKPWLPLLALSNHSEEIHGVDAIRAGAGGIVSKGKSSDDLVDAIRRVGRGGKYVSIALAEKLAAEIITNDGKLPHERLSEREFQILQLIGTGASVGAIAGAFSLSPKTVSTHRTRLLRKIGVASNNELMRYLLDHQLSD